MQYIVLDLEWNQPYDDSMAIKKPFHLTGEIIQIGAVKLDDDFNLLDTFKILVCPVKYRKLHRKVAKLTGLTAEDLEYGFPFQKALKYFRQWCGSDYVFMTWGKSDEVILRENLSLYELNAEWLPKIYDVQLIFSSQIGKENRQFSLVHSLEYLHEEVLDAHDALHDALNTMKVCRHLDMHAAFEIYDEIVRKVQGVTGSNCRVARYPSREAALADDQIAKFLCPECSKQVKCGEWVKMKQEVKVALAECPGCTQYYIRVRFRKDGPECFRATRRVSPLTSELLSRYMELKSIAEEKEAAYAAAIANSDH